MNARLSDLWSGAPERSGAPSDRSNTRSDTGAALQNSSRSGSWSGAPKIAGAIAGAALRVILNLQRETIKKFK